MSLETDASGSRSAHDAINGLRRGDRRERRIIQKHADVIVQAALVAVECEGIVAALIDDLLCDGALTVRRVRRHGCALQREHRQQFRLVRTNTARWAVATACGQIPAYSIDVGMIVLRRRAIRSDAGRRSTPATHKSGIV
jgi:hypothetical protein